MRRLLPLLMVASGLTLSDPVWAEGNVDKGKDLAVTHCSRCHVIGEFNKFGGIGSTPSFRLLKGMTDGMERFATFYERRPHPAFVRVPDVPKWSNAPAYAIEFTVTAEAIADLLAYVETIEGLDLRDIPVSGGGRKRQRMRGSR